MSQSSNPLSSRSNNTLPLKIKQIFLPLCQAVPDTEADTVKSNVSAYLQQMQQRVAQNEFLDLKTARQIAESLHHLLDSYPDYPENQKAMIIGAARYFIKDNDAEHDINSFLGLDDDVAVLNHVLTTTGHADKQINL